MYFISILALFSFCASLKVCGDDKCICDLETIHCTNVISFPRFSSEVMTLTKKIVVKDSWVRRINWTTFPRLEEIEIINSPLLCIEDVGKYIITGDYVLCATGKHSYFIFFICFLDL